MNGQFCPSSLSLPSIGAHLQELFSSSSPSSSPVSLRLPHLEIGEASPSLAGEALHDPSCLALELPDRCPFRRVVLAQHQEVRRLREDVAWLVGVAPAVMVVWYPVAATVAASPVALVHSGDARDVLANLGPPQSPPSDPGVAALMSRRLNGELLEQCGR